MLKAHGAVRDMDQLTVKDELVIALLRVACLPENGMLGSMSMSLTWCRKGPSPYSTAKGMLCCLQPTYDKLLAEVPKYKLITQSVLSDRLRVSNCTADLWRCVAT